MMKILFWNISEGISTLSIIRESLRRICSMDWGNMFGLMAKLIREPGNKEKCQELDSFIGIPRAITIMDNMRMIKNMAKAPSFGALRRDIEVHGPLD
jgi:hypothetical protein